MNANITTDCNSDLGEIGLLLGLILPGICTFGTILSMGKYLTCDFTLVVLHKWIEV
jgi:hypothetical protein